MQNQMKLPSQCCEKCKSPCYEEFKQVVKLKNSGLLIYIHDSDIMKKRSHDDIKGSIILHNSGNKELKRYDYIAELCQYKTKCYKCKALIQRVRSLIDNINTINRNDVLGICEFCKRSPAKNKCRRCEFIVNKFFNISTEQYLQNERRFYECLQKIQQILSSVMQGQIICKHNVFLDSESKKHFDELIKYMDWPIRPRIPNIEFFSDIFDKNIMENNVIIKSEDILSKLVTKISSEDIIDGKIRDEDSLAESTSTCLCKYLNKMKSKHYSFEKQKKIGDYLSTSLLEMKENEYVNLKDSPAKLVRNRAQSTTMPIPISIFQSTPTKSKRVPKPSPKGEAGKDKIVKNDVDIEKKEKRLKDSSSRLIINMLRERKTEIKIVTPRQKIKKYSKLPVLPDIESLIKRKIVVPEKSESILECNDGRNLQFTEIIKGDGIVPYYSYQTDDNSALKLPLLFHNQVDCTLPMKEDEKLSACSEEIENVLQQTNKEISDADHSGVVMYKLSNREFIDRGWTQLPTTKILRRMNIYKMIPSYPDFDWFKNHKKQKVLFYESGEKLAEIKEDSSGKWFYKNGNTALEYFNASDSEERCVIYSSGDQINSKKYEPVSILGCFDYRGNGIVFENSGNIRLKYNQSEGLLVDKSIGPPGRWKWHTLNDPPSLHPMFIDTYDEEEKNLQDFGNIEKSAKEYDEMVAIELENYVKEKAIKMKLELKPLPLRIKALKMNDYFSLRIVNQAKIYVLFRIEHICFKLNLGLLLKCHEIIDTDVADASSVATPYDGMQNRRL